MSQTLRYTLNMFLCMLIFSPIIIIWRTNLLKKNNNKTNILHEITLVIFLLFLIGLASQTIAPNFHSTRETGNINLKLFKVFVQTYHTIVVDRYLSYFLINFLGNILIFMPIGFFIPLLWHKGHHMIRTIFIGFLISLFIETAQLFLPRGTDVDDLWLNTLGTSIGYILFYIINKDFPKLISKFK